MTAQPDNGRIYNVLFLCTSNSTRSIMAEAILTRDGGGRFRGFSAGSQPSGSVNPLALKVLSSYGYPTEGLRSKGWEAFAASDAPVMDFVFTVCDTAAGEIAPVWPGQPVTAHWGIENPGRVEGTELEREAAFVAAFRYLRNRITVFAALPFTSLDKLTLASRLRDIGQLEGTSRPDPKVA
ncbi:arsenate reductase ArsC [Phreatobacter sp.]|uniref:arsenate reductase ArsC n=1 Tax=Phreatobacter sp. TaxID=1966341 RepID=UPI003F7143BF